MWKGGDIEMRWTNPSGKWIMAVTSEYYSSKRLEVGEMRRILILAVVLCCATIIRADLSTGLVAHYSFNGNANDVSGNELHGTVYGATLTADRFGNPNGAYYFDGVYGHIEVPNTGGAFNLTSAWTLSVWCQPMTATSSLSGPVVWKTAQVGLNEDTFGLAWLSTAYKERYMPSASPGDQWLLKIERASDDYDFHCFSSPSAPGPWYHLVGTYDGQDMRLYVDGVLDAVLSIGPVVAYTGPAPLMIGSLGGISNHGDDGVFHGAIGDIRIYNRALSAAEVHDLYVIPVPGAALLGLLGLGYTGIRLRRGAR
jgi:hypothetical protein